MADDKIRFFDSPPVEEQVVDQTTETPSPEVTETDTGGQPQEPWWKNEGFESEDKLRETFQQYRSLPNEVQALKEQLEQRKFAAPEVEALNQYVAQSGTDNVSEALAKFGRIYGRDFSTMSELDVIRESLSLVEGMDAETVKDYIVADFTPPKKLSDEDLAELEPEELAEYNRRHAAYRVKVTREAKAARENLMKLKETYTPKAVQADPAQAQAEQQAHVQKVTDVASKLNIAVPTAEFGDVAFELSPEQRQTLVQAFSQVRGADLENGMKSYAMAMFFPQIVKKIESHIKAQLVAEQHQDLNNISPEGRPAPAKAEDVDSAVFDQIQRQLAGY